MLMLFRETELNSMKQLRISKHVVIDVEFIFSITCFTISMWQTCSGSLRSFHDSGLCSDQDPLSGFGFGRSNGLVYVRVSFSERLRKTFLSSFFFLSENENILVCPSAAADVHQDQVLVSQPPFKRRKFSRHRVMNVVFLYEAASELAGVQS